MLKATGREGCRTEREQHLTAGGTTNPSTFLLSRLFTACCPFASHDPALPPNLFCSSIVGVLILAGFMSLENNASTVEAY